MSPDLDELLCKRYPALFEERRLPMTQTAMCWGFSCGDGWFLIINELCAEIQAAVTAGRIEQPVAVQVKEKFGELRFYLRGSSEEAERLVDEAERRSLETCEICGAPGVMRDLHRWYRTRCDKHAEPGSVVVPPEPESP